MIKENKNKAVELSKMIDSTLWFFILIGCFIFAGLFKN